MSIETQWKCLQQLDHKAKNENRNIDLLLISHELGKEVIKISFKIPSKEECHDKPSLHSITITFQPICLKCINKIKELFVPQENKENTLDEFIRTRKNWSVTQSPNSLQINCVDSIPIRSKIEKIFSLLDTLAPFEPKLKENIAKSFQLKAYALDSTFQHEAFEELKERLRDGSFKTFLLCMKHIQKKNKLKFKIPKYILHKIISSLFQSAIPPHKWNDYFFLAEKELACKDKKHKCILC